MPLSQHKRQLVTSFLCSQLMPEFVLKLQFFLARKIVNFERFFNPKIRYFLLKKGGYIERVGVYLGVYFKSILLNPFVINGYSVLLDCLFRQTAVQSGSTRFIKPANQATVSGFFYA